MRLYFNPRSPKGATDAIAKVSTIADISIHAPRRERQNEDFDNAKYYYISIHAPRRERRGCFSPIFIPINFNPRSPKGATQQYEETAQEFNLFQSTLPEGSDMQGTKSISHVINFNPRSPKGATKRPPACHCPPIISIHAPRRERQPISDMIDKGLNISIHAPRRERHGGGFVPCPVIPISIHAPRRERPFSSLLFLSAFTISIHAPRRERRGCHFR